MAGVIDEHGVQWEHCSQCAKWIRLENLGYEKPSLAHPHGRDLCMQCTNLAPDIEQIVPASEWIPVYARS